MATACSVFDKNVSSESKESDSVGGGNSSSETIGPGEEESKKTVWNKVANFSTGFSSADGGVAEIVKYNDDNGKFYLVNGKTQTLDIVTLGTLKDDKTQLETIFNEETDRISCSSLVI